MSAMLSVCMEAIIGHIVFVSIFFWCCIQKNEFSWQQCNFLCDLYVIFSQRKIKPSDQLLHVEKLGYLQNKKKVKTYKS